MGVTTDSMTKLLSSDYVPFWNMRYVEVGCCGIPGAVRFHLKNKGVPIRIEWNGGAELESDSRKGKIPRMMMSMSVDQAKLLYKLLDSIPGVRNSYAEFKDRQDQDAGFPSIIVGR